MNIQTTFKTAPAKFKGELKKIPLSTILNYISFTCFLSIKKDNDTGVLYFSKGKLINAVINNNFHIDEVKNIMKWTEGEFFYQKWTKDFEIEYRYLSDILYTTELNNFNAELSFIFNGQFVKIVCSEGKIVRIEPEPNDIKLFLNDILQETKGTVKIKETGAQTGNLKEYFSEIINRNTKIKKQASFSKKKLSGTTSKRKNPADSSTLKMSAIEKLFSNLQNDLEDQFLAGSLYSSDTGKPIYSYNSTIDKSALFVKLHKSINKLLTNEGYKPKNNYYLFDLKENYLILILIFKKHHFGFAFDSKKIKFGYLFNIIIPLVTNDYKNTIK